MARGTGSGRTEASVLPVMPRPVPAAPVTAPPGRAPPSTLGQKPLHTLPPATCSSRTRREASSASRGFPRLSSCSALGCPIGIATIKSRDGGQSNWKELKRKG